MSRLGFRLSIRPSIPAVPQQTDPRSQPNDTGVAPLTTHTVRLIGKHVNACVPSVENTTFILYLAMHSREVISALKDDEWFLVRTRGSHHHFAHETKQGIVTVPHPKKDLARGLLKGIEKQAGITLR